MSVVSGIVPAVIYLIKKELVGKTPRGLASCWAPNAGNMVRGRKQQISIRRGLPGSDIVY